MKAEGKALGKIQTKRLGWETLFFDKAELLET